MKNGAADHEGVRCGAGSRDVGGGVAQLVGILVDDQPTVVDEQHVLEQVGDLVDEMSREHDGPRMFRVVREQTVVEQRARDC